MTDICDRLMDYDNCCDSDVDEAVVEIQSLRKQLAQSKKYKVHKEFVAIVNDCHAKLAELDRHNDEPAADDHSFCRNEIQALHDKYLNIEKHLRQSIEIMRQQRTEAKALLGNIIVEWEISSDMLVVDSGSTWGYFCHACQVLLEFPANASKIVCPTCSMVKLARRPIS